MLVIVTSHWKEDLGWLKKSKFPVVIVDKIGSDPSPFEPAFIIPNKGKELSVYLKYIIENYDNLPDNVAFIHGHENSYHHGHDRPLLEVIEGANLTHGYIPLNGWVRFYPFYNEVGTLDAPRVWDILKLPSELKPEGMMIYQPYLQFIASRDRLLRHPKSFYEHIFECLMNEEIYRCGHSEIDISRYAIFCENVFHIIMGENQVCFYNPGWFKFEFYPKLWGGYEGPVVDKYNEFLLKTYNNK